MTQGAGKPIPLPPTARFRTHLAWLTIIFACGAIIGGVGGSILTRQRMLAILRNPQQVPDRIVPLIRSELVLNAQQAAQVEEIVRQRYANIELLRADVYPSQREEFTAMSEDIARLLNEQQQAAWTALLSTVEQHYLPREPPGPPIDLIFLRFDANNDNILTQDEIPSRMWRRLGMADGDGDGKVTRDEFLNAASGRSAG